MNTVQVTLRERERELVERSEDDPMGSGWEIIDRMHKPKSEPTLGGRLVRGIKKKKEFSRDMMRMREEAEGRREMRNEGIEGSERKASIALERHFFLMMMTRRRRGRRWRRGGGDEGRKDRMRVRWIGSLGGGLMIQARRMIIDVRRIKFRVRVRR